MTLELGTCFVTFGEDEYFCDIFGISNKKKGNGHFNKTVEWFEARCKLNGKTLMFTSIENERLKKHLIEKRFFTLIGNSAAEKRFKKNG